MRNLLSGGGLPRELTGFVGRQHELAVILDQLQKDAGLLTLTGIGGVGKTRLANRAAALVQAIYPDGARLITLGQVPEGGDVAVAVLAGLGLRERTGTSSTDSLVYALRDKRLLMVLDNCEHVIQASARLVQELLLGCPDISILATSRELLGVPGERVFRVQPLRPPADDEPYAALADSEAVELFVERARTADPTFELTVTSGAAVARICRLVDGIPLAVELAAARTTSMSVAEISDHLSDPLSLLTRGPRTAPARQQTLRATLDWSYGLLTEQERALLRRLAAFNGGCTLEAATAVCAGPDLPAERVIDVLDRLVAKSLVTAVKDTDSTRFTLLDTVRGYMLGCLVVAGEDGAIRARHRDWCLDVAERARPEWFDSAQFGLVQREEDNLLAALRWTIESDQAAAAGRLAHGLGPLWLLRGRFAEGRAQLMAIVDLPTAAGHPLQTSLVFTWAANLAYNEGQFVVAEDLARRALACAEAAGSDYATILALIPAGQSAMGQGELARAAQHFEAGLERADTDVPQAVMHAYRLAEVMVELGNRTRAEELLTQALKWTQASQYRFALGRVQAARAIIADHAGDPHRADNLLAEAIECERGIGVPGLIEVLTTSGAIFSDRGDRVRAAEVMSEALACAVSHGSHIRIANVLEVVCGLVVAGHPAACVRMAAAAHELRDSLRALPKPSERRRLATHLEEARRRLGESAYASIWKAAGATSLEAVIDEGHLLLRQVAEAVIPAPAPASAGSEVLTERELDVTRLVMRGMSNREIAEELVVTRKTAEAHIGHILTKLGLTNRVQIATWGHERGVGIDQAATGGPNARLVPGSRQ